MKSMLRQDLVEWVGAVSIAVFVSFVLQIAQWLFFPLDVNKIANTMQSSHNLIFFGTVITFLITFGVYLVREAILDQQHPQRHSPDVATIAIKERSLFDN